MFGTTTQKKKLEFNEALLKELATETGGQYFHATDNEALKKIYASINQLEKNKVQLTSYNHYSDRFLNFLIVGVILLIIEMILRLTLFKKFP
jgi:Ca-activated chloride channel family protein